ncbi:MAG: hypothetical protein KGH59_02485 [Candidatus Micrarchaeota archaeon]|nr:hypothetical protein [Candidatus Micrarchaeota archaeon]MDE1804624.1 hypothetical protein [Candidatus Micrarchaeota archaeon]
MAAKRVLPENISEMTYAHYVVLEALGTPREIKEFDGMGEKQAFKDLKKMGLIGRFETCTWPAYIRTERGNSLFDTIEKTPKIKDRFEAMEKAEELRGVKRITLAPMETFGKATVRY